MSQNVEGVNGSNGGTREEENVHESSKMAFNNQNSALVNPDDELLSWLQYPIDDDIFHHWPPPSTTSPASADFFSSSFSSFSLSSSSPLFSSSLAVKHLPQLENEAFMVAKDLERRVIFDDWIHKEDMESEFFQGEQSTALKNKAVAIGQECTSGVKDHYEAYHLDNREGERRAAGVWATRLVDWKQGSVKDCKKLAQSKPTPEEEREGWEAREAQVVGSKGAPHPMHPPSEKAIGLSREQDTHMQLTAHSPQNVEEKGLQRTYKVKEESLLQFAQASNAEYRLKNDMVMKLNAKKGTPLIGRPQAHSNVDAALALGAGRAAGTLRPPGMEAFSKVRTSLQPTQPVPLGSPSSSSFPLSRTLSGKNLFSPASCNWMATRSRPLGSSGSMPASQLSYQTGEIKLPNPAQLLVCKPYGGFSNMGIRENQFNLKGNTKNIKGNITKTSSEQLPTVPLLSPKEVGTPIDGTQNVLIPEDTMAGGSSNTCAPSDPDTTDLQKLSSVSFLSQDRRTAGSTCSGGSQTSESLREPVSGIKRKLSECQSEEAEEDSVVSSQARTSTSKRPRANDVHNLSERRRRNRINDKMNALRELIPNASKSNKAALLDEAIDYLKNLQLQLQLMSLRTGVSLMPMALPPSVPHMPIPEYGSLGTMGMDLSGGSALASAVSTMGIGKHKTYAVPAGGPGSVSARSMTDMRPLQPLAASHSFSQFQVLPDQFHHPHVQASSQITFPRREEQQQQQQQQTRGPPTTA